MVCHECCITCEKYSTVKEQKAKCETRKARAKRARHALYMLKKNNK
jgi:hypothetical protein